jgi:hypothetical protein
VRVCHMFFPQRTAVALNLLMLLGSMATADPTIQLRPGFSTLRSFDRPIGTIVVGNPEVADVTLQSERQIVVTAKKVPGTTNVMVLDANNNKFFDAEIVVGGAEQIPGRVQIHSRSGDKAGIHEYYAYNCPQGDGLCERVKDELESMPRPIFRSQIVPPDQPPGAEPQPAPPEQPTR